jgi:hypothetical protein
MLKKYYIYSLQRKKNFNLWVFFSSLFPTMAGVKKLRLETLI